MLTLISKLPFLHFQTCEKGGALASLSTDCFVLVKTISEICDWCMNVGMDSREETVTFFVASLLLF